MGTGVGIAVAVGANVAAEVGLRVDVRTGASVAVWSGDGSAVGVGDGAGRDVGELSEQVGPWVELLGFHRQNRTALGRKTPQLWQVARTRCPLALRFGNLPQSPSHEQANQGGASRTFGSAYSWID